MIKWWTSLTDEGQMMLICLAIVSCSWVIVLSAMLSVYCFGFPGLVQPLLDFFKAESWALGSVLGLFLGHSVSGRVFGKPDNMKDIVEQKEAQ